MKECFVVIREIAEDVSGASRHSKKAEEIVGEAFELFVEADEVLMLADKEGFECLREIFCYSEKVQSGEAFGHSVEDFGHWGEVFWSSVEDFGHLEGVPRTLYRPYIDPI